MDVNILQEVDSTDTHTHLNHHEELCIKTTKKLHKHADTDARTHTYMYIATITCVRDTLAYRVCDVNLQLMFMTNHFLVSTILQ